MITEEERNEVINAAVEKTLLLIPEVIGSLMSSHAALHKINTKFYADHPEFKDKKGVVASVVEMIEGKNPLATYEDILREAVPIIKERINVMKNLDMENVNLNPDRNLKGLDIAKAGNNNPCGEI